MFRKISISGILPQPDERSYITYVLLLAIIPFTYLCYYLAEMKFDASWKLPLELLAAFVIFNAWMIRRAGHHRISTSIEVTCLMAIKGLLVLALQFALITIPAPYADTNLRNMDASLGFYWEDFARFSIQIFSFDLLKFAYSSMIWQAALLVAILCLLNQETRAWRLLTASTISLIITILVFGFFPADGSYVGCGLKPPDVPIMQGMCDYGPIIHRIKDEGLRVIEPSMAAGLVTFPSFHAAAGAVLIWGSWSVKILRIPGIVLNVLMLAGTITVGGHYLVDVLGGILVACFSIWAARRYVGPPSQASSSFLDDERASEL